MTRPRGMNNMYPSTIDSATIHADYLNCLYIIIFIILFFILFFIFLIIKQIKNNINKRNKEISELNKMRDYFNSIDDEERAEIIKIVKAETEKEYKKSIQGDVYAWAYIISNMSK